MDGNTVRERRRSRSRERHRSRSRERKNQQRSKSRSKSPEGFDPSKERRRPTWFDIPPVGGAPPPMSQLPGAVHVIPDNASSSAAVASHAGGANQQATRHARRIYVGGLPPSAGEDNIASFFRFVQHRASNLLYILINLHIIS
jgi:splicing factor U2AF subunit